MCLCERRDDRQGKAGGGGGGGVLGEYKGVAGVPKRQGSKDNQHI